MEHWATVLFLLSPGKMLLMLSLIQEWLDARNVTVVAHFLKTPVHSGSWCTDFSYGHPCCLCIFSCRTFSFQSTFLDYATIQCSANSPHFHQWPFVAYPHCGVCLWSSSWKLSSQQTSSWLWLSTHFLKLLIKNCTFPRYSNFLRRVCASVCARENVNATEYLNRIYPLNIIQYSINNFVGSWIITKRLVQTA